MPSLRFRHSRQTSLGPRRGGWPGAGLRPRRLAVGRAFRDDRPTGARRVEGPGTDCTGHGHLRRLGQACVLDLPGTAARRAAGRHLASPDSGHRVGGGSALLRSQRRRSGAHPRRQSRQHPAGPHGAGRQHAHAAAGATELPDPGQDLHAQNPGSAARHPHRERVLEGSDPGALPQQDVLRRRPLRRGSGGARLLRQARP